MNKHFWTTLLLTLLVACGGSSQTPGDGNPGEDIGEIASISLTPTFANIQVGQPQTFTAVAKDADGNPVDTEFTWSSALESVATISDGVASAKAAGQTQITASAGGVTSNSATLIVSSAEGIPGTLFGTVSVPPDGDVAGTQVIACFPVGKVDCDEQRSQSLEISGSGPSASYSFEGLEEETYIVVAFKDIDGGGLDEGDYYGESAPVTPPATGVNVTMEVIGGGGDGGGGGTPSENAIAYVKALSWDEIRLIDPDGTNDRLLWTHGLNDPNDGYGYDIGIYNVFSLAWRPDGSELAFDSTHERDCSLNTSDIFAIGADGNSYRRITQAPACPALDNYPKGTVQVPVQNPYGSQVDMFIYFQGAPAPQPISVPGNGSAVVTFDNVADLGAGVLQRAILIETVGGDDRDFGENTAVDVQAGSTVQTPELTLDFPNNDLRHLHAPTWHSGGAKLGYAFNHRSLFEINATPAPLEQGELLVTAGSTSPGWLNWAEDPRWGPESRADELLYIGKDDLTNEGIYLVSAESASPGERLIAGETVGWVSEDFLDLAWLPDGSGFVYSVLEAAPEAGSFGTKANLYEYTFATGEVTPLTDLEATNYAGRLSLSPDGAQIVFERSNRHPDFTTGELHDADLWIMSRDDTNMRLLVEDARAPAWSR